MVSLIALTEAMVDTLRRVPELVTALGGAEFISGYIDMNPEWNSVSKAVYQMKPGSVLVIWEETDLTQGQMVSWIHRMQIFVRALRGQSAMTLINLIVDGVPQPGDGLRWRYCPIMPGVLPTMVPAISRPSDEEGIDYFAITTDTQETGDA